MLNKDSYKQNFEEDLFQPHTPKEVNLMKQKPIWKKKKELWFSS